LQILVAWKSELADQEGQSVEVSPTDAASMVAANVAVELHQAPTGTCSVFWDVDAKRLCRSLLKMAKLPANTFLPNLRGLLEAHPVQEVRIRNVNKDTIRVERVADQV
jgi:hypothetical protein